MANRYFRKGNHDPRGLSPPPPLDPCLSSVCLPRCYTRVNDLAHRIEYISSKAALCVFEQYYFGFCFLIYTHGGHVLISFPPYFRSHVCGVCHAKLVWRVYYLWLFSSILFSIVIPRRKPSRPAQTAETTAWPTVAVISYYGAGEKTLHL